jgi:Na+-translocating ferredoxin:NAD+ oxidoreductase RnfE subunit
MTRTNDRHGSVALVLLGPLLANTTSIFNAAMALLVLVPVVLVLALLPTRVADKDPALHRAIAISTGAIFSALLLMGINAFAPAPWAIDIVEAYAATLMLAALAVPGLTVGSTPALSLFRFAALLITTGALCEILGYGVVLGDHEIAFAGATMAWQIRLVGFAPLPLAASPAGALVIAGLVYGAMQWRKSAAQNSKTTATAVVISEPRNGRRVRVTGHIS